jgi:LysM repeat protein
MIKRLIAAAFVLILATGAALAQDAETQGDPVIHKVLYGESLFRIALKYGITVDELAAANDIVYTWSIQVGQELIIPGLAQPDEADVVANPLVAAAPVQHVIRPGETLAGIARRYDVDVDLILRANNITNPNLIYYGQTLNIWTPQTVDSTVDPSTAEVEAEAPDTSAPANAVTIEDAAADVAAANDSADEIPFTHVIGSGETLGRIALRYDVTLDELMSANAIANPNAIVAGTLLVIPGRSGRSQVSSTNPAVLAQFEAQATISEGKQVVVDLSEQRVYAFENGVMVFTALVSTGLPATPTVLGDYEVYLRYDAQRMTGPGYDLPGVQWVQYFYQGYALHGTYWHENFGEPMSHGCVNLQNADALWLYNWATIGTPVHVKA